MPRKRATYTTGGTINKLPEKYAMLPSFTLPGEKQKYKKALITPTNPMGNPTLQSAGTPSTISSYRKR